MIFPLFKYVAHTSIIKKNTGAYLYKITLLNGVGSDKSVHYQ